MRAGLQRGGHIRCFSRPHTWYKARGFFELVLSSSRAAAAVYQGKKEKPMSLFSLCNNLVYYQPFNIRSAALPTQRLLKISDKYGFIHSVDRRVVFNRRQHRFLTYSGDDVVKMSRDHQTVNRDLTRTIVSIKRFIIETIKIKGPPS